MFGQPKETAKDEGTFPWQFFSSAPTKSPFLYIVVYKYKYRQSDSTYIGETNRHFANRIAEHRLMSVRTGFRLTTPTYSMIL